MAIEADRAGAFELSDVYLISYSSPDGSGTPSRLNIRQLIMDLNIYESLDGSFLSGDITLTDATNIIQEFPLTGYERIEFILKSPMSDKGFDFSVNTGHPMFVYALENRQEGGPRFQVYTLKFCSLETVRNHQNRISQAYSSSIDEMILNVCVDGLKTKKNIFVEETKGLHKYVIPRINPMETIQMLRKDARSKHYNNSGFLFYENAFGFNFKSYEGLFCKKDGTPRPVKANYTPKIKNVLVHGDKGKTLYDLQSVEEFKVKQQYNTLQNLQNGVYASRMVTHDGFNKTFDEHDFDYNKDYINHNHLEMSKTGGVRDNNGILPMFNYSEGYRFGDFAEGTLMFSTVTENTHDNITRVPFEEIVQQRVSSHLAINSLAMDIQVPGTTNINVGDIVNFTMPKYAKATNNDILDEDKYLSGRYLVSAVRHHISSIGKKHTMVLELIKDSFNISYPEENMDIFTANEDNNGQNYLQSLIDDYI